MDLFENLQHLKEFDKPVKVSNKNYKRTLKEINDVISSVSQKELIPKQCNEIIEDIYYKVIELKNMFKTELENKSIEELTETNNVVHEDEIIANTLKEFCELLDIEYKESWDCGLWYFRDDNFICSKFENLLSKAGLNKFPYHFIDTHFGREFGNPDAIISVTYEGENGPEYAMIEANQLPIYKDGLIR